MCWDSDKIRITFDVFEPPYSPTFSYRNVYSSVKSCVRESATACLIPFHLFFLSSLDLRISTIFDFKSESITEVVSIFNCPLDEFNWQVFIIFLISGYELSMIGTRSAGLKLTSSLPKIWEICTATSFLVGGTIWNSCGLLLIGEITFST